LNDTDTDIVYDAGRIYATTGQVIDPEARVVVGTFVGVNGSSVVPDSAANRAYFLAGVSYMFVSVFDLTTYAFLSRVDIVYIPDFARPGSFTRCGEDSLAMRLSDRVFIVRMMHDRDEDQVPDELDNGPGLPRQLSAISQRQPERCRSRRPWRCLRQLPGGEQRGSSGFG
jgi:hypothetical protein